MFSTLRTRFGLPGVISTVALVFAMTGGAFAAKYLITSTKQISPSVLKKLKGAAGPAGPAGAAGTQGPAGPSGAAGGQGEKGEKGATGANGTSVTASPAGGECIGGGTKFTVGAETKFVCNGEEGLEGPEGPTGPAGPTGAPWPAGGTLPSNSTETGSWYFRIPAASASIQIPISFSIPLKADVPGTNVHYVDKNKAAPADCDDGAAPAASPDHPEADAGHLCVFGAEAEGAKFGFNSIIKSASASGASPGASTTGALVTFLGEPGAENRGSFAVTG